MAMEGGRVVQQRNHQAAHDPVLVKPVARPQRPAMNQDPVATARRYMMTRPVLFGTLLGLLILHWALPSAFDLGTMALILGMYLLAVGSGGLEAARLSGTGGDRRRQERLAEDALRRAGKLQSHLDPCTATDDVVNRILASGTDPRHMVVDAANEVEDALRAVYRHYSEAERMAGTSIGIDLPLAIEVQEMIYRGLLPIDVWETAEPILSLRDMASAPRCQISQQVATDMARATQAIILRVQALGIKVQTNRTPVAWLRFDADEHVDEPDVDDQHDGADGDTDREARGSEAPLSADGQLAGGDRLGASIARDPVGTDAARRDPRPRQGVPGPSNPRN
jgi:hypothetical protein